MGRKSQFNRATADKVIAALKLGTPLTVICREDGMPCDDTIRNWGDADEEFGREIARAREIGFDAIAAECLTIADQPNKRITEDGDAIENDPQRDRLRVDTRLKLLAKWDPKRYGDRQHVEHSGAVTVAASAHDEAL